MRNLIKKLGKPKSWWLTMGCVVAALPFGLIVMAIYWLGVTSHMRASIYVLLAMWLTGVFGMMIYCIGQLSGRYKNLKGRGWTDLPW